MFHKLDFTKPLLVLAPLAGYTDLPFRSVVKKFGADLTISEMISSNAIAYNNEKTLKMTEKSANENPYFIQLAASKIDIVAKAVEEVNKLDGVDGIDLNCGCPAPKVFNHGSGSNLLGDLPRLQKIIETIKKYSNKKYTTVKVRIGVDEKIPLDIAKALADVGVDMVSVHGRTKKGAYKAPVDYDAIKTIVDNIGNIPVIANGDIKDYDKAQKVLEYTGASGVMIGRGAIGNPWIFHQLSTGDKYVTKSLKKEIILEHFDKMIEFYEAYGAVMFRKHLHTYSKGFDGASAFRDKINTLLEPNQMRDAIMEFFPDED